MTKHECAVVTAFTGISMLNGKDLRYLYNYLSGFIGRPVYSHEIPTVAETYKEQIREDFLDLCRNAKEADDG